MVCFLYVCNMHVYMHMRDVCSEVEIRTAWGAIRLETRTQTWTRTRTQAHTHTRTRGHAPHRKRGGQRAHGQHNIVLPDGIQSLHHGLSLSRRAPVYRQTCEGIRQARHVVCLEVRGLVYQHQQPVGLRGSIFVLLVYHVPFKYVCVHVLLCVCIQKRNV